MRIFYAVLVLIYIVWYAWYGGSGEPVTEAELESYMEIVKGNAESRDADPSHALDYMQRLASSDDGDEFLMVNLIRYRSKAEYPEGSPWADDPDAMAADARYSRGIVPQLLKRGSLPVVFGDVAGPFINDPGGEEWDRVGMVRYRSARDMLDMIVEMSTTDLATHKWASIEQTHVFPMKPVISLITMRLLLAGILLALALLVTLAASLLRQPTDKS